MDWIDLPFEEAIKYLRGKTPMTRDQFDSLAIETRGQAFTASRVLKLESLQTMLDRLVAAAEEGITLNDFADQIETSLDVALSPAHLETIFRTNLQSAFGRGKWEQGTDPDVVGEIWGWRYHTVEDDRVREEHEALEGMTFALGEGDAVFPPWDYNCRCSAEWITKGEAEEEGIASDLIPSDAQDVLNESDFASPALAVEYEPDLSGYDVNLINEFVKDQEAEVSR